MRRSLAFDFLLIVVDTVALGVVASLFLLVLSCLFGLNCMVFAGQPADSVVIVECGQNAGTGVCVHPSGLVMTAKHVADGDGAMITFARRKVSAHCVYRCPEDDGPVVFDCDGDGFPAVQIADRVPLKGSKVWSCGWPTGRNGKPVSIQARGTMRGGMMMRSDSGRGVPVNRTDFFIYQGWSGGPLFDVSDAVCGIALTSDFATDSQWASYASVKRAYNAAVAGLPDVSQAAPPPPDAPPVPAVKPTLYLFTQAGCKPCQDGEKAFHSNQRFADAVQARFHVQFVDANSEPALVAKYNIVKTPTAVCDNPAIRIVGWATPEKFLADLALARSDEISAAPLQSAPSDGSQPASPIADKVENVAGILGTGLSIAQLALTVATGGVGGLAIPVGLAALRLLSGVRKRRESDARPPPVQPQFAAAPSPIMQSVPFVVTQENPPPPAQIITETRFTPVERDTHREAYEYAKTETVRKYPAADTTFAMVDGLINQYIASKAAAAK